MESGGNKRKRSVTRRDFLRSLAFLRDLPVWAPFFSAPFVADALAQTKTLRILQWSHFVPQYDSWFDGFAKDWGKKNGITVTVDHIPHLELPDPPAARAC